jgi:hypothetical protein
MQHKAPVFAFQSSPVQTIIESKIDTKENEVNTMEKSKLCTREHNEQATLSCLCIKSYQDYNM